jgi:hypothetical protein
MSTMSPDPGDIIRELNERDAPAIFAFGRELAGPEGARTLGLIRDFRAGLGFGQPEGLGSSPELEPRGFSLHQPGAAAFVGVLQRHPAFTEGRELRVGFLLIEHGPDDPRLYAARLEATEVLIIGALALGAVGSVSDRDFRGLMHVGFGADAMSCTFRHTLLGKPVPDSNGCFQLSDWLLEPPLGAHGCVAGIQDALAALGRAASSSRATSSAAGIISLNPNAGCAGTAVAIQGSGFGASQPAGRDVYFPSASGRCSRAQVQSWSDTQIVAVAPSDVGTGCVGFIDRPSGDGSLYEAASALAGELEQCVGLAAANAAAKLRNVPQAFTSCPPCLAGGANRFSGGPPSLDYFLVNGGSTVDVEPNTALSLSWKVAGATGLSITRTSIAGPFSPPPSPLPAVGSHALGTFVGTTPATGTYKLVATNGCGTVSRTVTVNLQKTPALSIGAIEVVQAIQHPGNSVRLVARKRTMVRVFVDSGISDGFDSGAGSNLVGGVSGSASVLPAGASFSSSAIGPLNANGVASARPAASFNRADGTHSLNFELPVNKLTAGTARIDVRVFAPGHQNDYGGPWTATASTTVTFLAQPTQELLPILIVDPGLGLPAPTLAQYNTSLGGARARYPIADDGFIVNPALLYSTVVPGMFPHVLTTEFGWGTLLLDIATMTFLFPTTPVGGIRTGLVPSDPRYALNGIATPRIAVSIPSQLSQAALQGTFAHEMGHTFGLNHANCCLPSGEVPDSRLPASTDDVGMNVPTRTVIPAGRGELMSYCGDTSACPGATRWPSTAFWDFVFGRIPI